MRDEKAHFASACAHPCSWPWFIGGVSFADASSFIGAWWAPYMRSWSRVPARLTSNYTYVQANCSHITNLQFRWRVAEWSRLLRNNTIPRVCFWTKDAIKWRGFNGQTSQQKRCGIPTFSLGDAAWRVRAGQQSASTRAGMSKRGKAENMA